MRIASRVVLVPAGVVVAGFAVVMVGAETREVVVLHTTGADGASHTTRLWIVDDADGPWLRAGHDGSSWFRDLEARPDVEVEWGGETLAVRAVSLARPRRSRPHQRPDGDEVRLGGEPLRHGGRRRGRDPDPPRAALASAGVTGAGSRSTDRRSPAARRVVG
jgi:hypothetical protein